jgi:transcriptional regulator with PAS, ATPase and Fis domain
MALLERQIPKIASSRHTALITGESGTGKSRLARKIHDLGPRRAAPFVSLSCAALPRELLESELFGHERGAFSGAVRQKPGRVELAHRGTLFLDEIGDMPLDLQPKLLTFLQDRSFFRLGGHELLDVDVRLIAATNRDLAGMVRDGSFREDLFFRLNVLPARLPALRERPDEIPVLALAFLNSALAEFGGTKEVALSHDALDLLLRHPWPGNIRELENAMFRAATLVEEGCEIGPELIAPGLLDERPPDSPPARSDDPILTLAEVERRELARALDRHAGHKPSVAAALGISEKSVYNMIRRHGLKSAPPASDSR